MKRSRRWWLLASGASAGLLCLSRSDAAAADPTDGNSTGANPIGDDELMRIASEPVLDLGKLTSPVTIRTIELLTRDGEYFVRVRSTDGEEGISVANAARFRDAYPIFVNRVAPFFVGKDAREIESLLVELYREGSNYKWQGLAFWVCVAAAEMAVLDLLGRHSGQSFGELFGGVHRQRIAVYRASGNRGNTPEAEVDYLRELLDETGGNAVKFRLGGRMSNNRDSLPGRTEKLIALARRELGPDVVLYADANSSYDVDNAIRIGRLMEEHDYAFFEEPCPFDHLWETKQVSEALTIPVAGGEQEFSMRRFRWTIANRGVDIVQPDLHYFGGLIRSTRVAKMAEAAGMPCTAHMSGGGLGYVYAIHFASLIADPGPHQEFKGLSRIPFDCPTSSLNCHDGQIDVPTGPGLGLTIAADYLQGCTVVRGQA